MSPEEQQKYLEEKQLRLAEANQRIRERNHEIEYGSINTAMVCPHCQSIGKIRTKEVKQKKGVSGGKATAAVLTAGLSLLAVGLSRKEGSTQAHCDNCNNTWFF
ncbi:hypothetical protein [Methyloglobulus sp.]|uniref:hypothetical protein n=1 Tax=Methyloglobulus sp. TaxID=2518622 RepID=UPI003988BD4B